MTCRTENRLMIVAVVFALAAGLAWGTVAYADVFDIGFDYEAVYGEQVDMPLANTVKAEPFTREIALIGTFNLQGDKLTVHNCVVLGDPATTKTLSTIDGVCGEFTLTLQEQGQGQLTVHVPGDLKEQFKLINQRPVILIADMTVSDGYVVTINSGHVFLVPPPFGVDEIESGRDDMRPAVRRIRGDR